MYGVLSGWAGGSDVGSESGEAGRSEVEELGSILGFGAIVREVNAFTGSERFREKDAFSAQIAHWSRGRAQYFPLRGNACRSASCFIEEYETPRMD